MAYLQCATGVALCENITLIPSLAADFTESRCFRPPRAEVYGLTFASQNPDLIRAGFHDPDADMEINPTGQRTPMQVVLACLSLSDAYERCV